MARPHSILLAPLALMLAGCGGADLVSSGEGAKVTVSPQVALMEAGASTSFNALVTGTTNQTVTWSVVGGSTHGAFSGTSGVYTAPGSPGTYTVLATSAADATKAGTALAVVSPPATVTVNPATVTLGPGASQLFTAVLSGPGSQGVTWSVQGGSANGSFTGTSGYYTAPSLSGTYTVLATSNDNPSRIGTATVTVNSPVTVRVSPVSVNLLPGGTQTFSATVTGISPTTVDWSVVESGGGSINSETGAYVAPITSGTYTVKATSRASASSIGTAQVTVSPVSLAISPASVTLDQGATQIFTPVLSGTTNPLVAWYINSGTATSQLGPYLYTAPATAGTYLLRAVPAGAPNVQAIAVITVSPVTMSPISPAMSVVPAGGNLSLSATVSGTTNTGITWSVLEGGAGGTINSSGVYHVDTSIAGTDTILATASADASVTQRALVTVGSVTISPSSSLSVTNTSGRITFSATVSGVSDPGVTWDILPTANGGTISAVGYFSAPTQPGVYRIRATSIVNAALFGEVQVTVN